MDAPSGIRPNTAQSPCTREPSVKVPFYRHSLSPADAGPIAEVLASPFLTSGRVGERVEGMLTDYFGVRHAALVNSWTNGAVAALPALGIGAGDEVIVPAMTFIATANVVELVGATPVFSDVDESTLLLTPAGVATSITSRTRAVIPVHLYGQMADVRGIRAALGSRNVAIVEDAAHAFESVRDGSRPGAHSDAAIFSFYATKNVTCGEGGALVTNRDDLHEAFLQTRLHGMTASAADRFTSVGYRHWDMVRLGTKANLPDVLAALLPSQIHTVAERLDRRAALAARYEAGLRGAEIRWPSLVLSSTHARHLFPVHVAPQHRDTVLARLHAAGIGVTVNYRAVPTLEYYRARNAAAQRDCPISTSWGDGTLSLPLYPSLTHTEQDYVLERLLASLDGLDRDVGSAA